MPGLRALLKQSSLGFSTDLANARRNCVFARP